MTTVDTTGSTGRVSGLLGDTWVMTRRNLRKHVRVPAQLIYSTALPVMWVLLFLYVFGGSIQVPGVEYIDYLLPGILVLAMAFGVGDTALGFAEDQSGGATERFRSQPVNRAAPVLGRVVFDVLRNAMAIAIAVAVGYAVGFQFHNGPLAALAVVGIVLAVGFAASWLGILLGLAIRDSEAAQTAGLLLSIPLIFASSIFVQVGSMPGWLQAVANNSPVTHAVDAARALTFDQPAGRPAALAVAWVAGIVVVALPLAVYRYQRAAR